LHKGDHKGVRHADSAPLAPGLYVVATPIGNLEDITLRALRVLREVDLIACEDTRHTQKLLNHFEIKSPTRSYHEHNEAARGQELIDRVSKGERIALVSDAGMPGISDPGERVIRAALERGLSVVAIPGPSAMISALVASGLPTDSFRFVGFLPARRGERRGALDALRNAPETLVFYEAPHRILEMLADFTKKGWFTYTARKNEAEARFFSGECSMLTSSSGAPGISSSLLHRRARGR